MPVSAITDDFVRSEIVGRVEAIAEKERNLFEVRVSLAAETVGRDPGRGRGPARLVHRVASVTSRSAAWP